MTVRLGVSSYTYPKLKEVLQRYAPETAVAAVRALIMSSLDEELDLGQREGGNCVFSWDPIIWGYKRWSPSESS